MRSIIVFIVAFLAGVAVIIPFAAFSYLLEVGIVALLQWAINLTFHTSFDYNVWGMGLILFLLIRIFNSVFRGQNTK